MVSQDFAKNVLIILRHDGVKIGEFEKSHGMSTGYLSRIANFTGRSVSLDLADSIAADLELTIQEIITTDWVKEFEEEDRLAKIQALEEEQKRIAKELENLKR